MYALVLDIIKTESNSFIDCIKRIKQDNTKDDFVKFIDKYNLKTYLVENSKNFPLFYNEKMFDTKPSIKFPIAKDSLDLLSILAIEKMGLAPKASSSKSQRKKESMNEDFTKEKEVIEQFIIKVKEMIKGNNH